MLLIVIVALAGLAAGLVLSSHGKTHSVHVRTVTTMTTG